jgi:Uncharacterised nucleotidyltransferase
MVEAVLPPSIEPSLKRSDSFHLLCACAITNPSPEQVFRIAHADYSSLDWTGLIYLAEHHGILPLVARNLANHAPSLPAEFTSVLQSTYEANLRRNLWFAAELLRIHKHFEERQLPAIAYKGPALAASVYGDIGLRSFSDLDLLIAPADFTRAKSALAEIGYRPSQQSPPAVERFFLRTGYERSFDSESGKNLLELQWSLLPRFYAVDFESADFAFNALFARAEPVEICDQLIPGLSPEDSLLALSIHAAKHLWTRLIWIADIAQTLHSHAIDISLVIARAQALGIRRILGVSLWLSNRLLGTTIPAEAKLLLDDDSDVATCGERCAFRLSCAANYNFESSSYFKQIAALRERPVDRFRYLFRLAWIPGPGDIAAVQLPEILFPLYHGVRAVRLLRKIT